MEFVAKKLQQQRVLEHTSRTDDRVELVDGAERTRALGGTARQRLMKRQCNVGRVAAGETRRDDVPDDGTEVELTVAERKVQNRRG